MEVLQTRADTHWMRLMIVFFGFRFDMLIPLRLKIQSFIFIMIVVWKF